MRLASKQDVVAIQWDEREDTIEEINKEICSVMEEYGYERCKAGRCYNRETDTNDSKNLYISHSTEMGRSETYFKPGEWVVMDLTKPYVPVVSRNTKDLFAKYKKIS